MTTNRTEVQIKRERYLAEVATAINREHRACEAAARGAVMRAIETGRLLMSAKQELKHGGWQRWMEEHLEFSDRTARVYMQLAKQVNLLEVGALASGDYTLRDALATIATIRDDDDDTALADKTDATAQPPPADAAPAGTGDDDSKRQPVAVLISEIPNSAPDSPTTAPQLPPPSGNGILGSTGPLSGRLRPASNGSAPDCYTPAPTAPKPDPEPSTDARGPQQGSLPAESEPKPAPASGQKEFVCDQLGNPVPEEYHATFRNLGAARAIHKQLCLARRLVKEYCAGPLGGWAVARELWAHQTNAIREFLASLPYAMCPECAGAQKVPDPKRPKHRQRCESCEGKGYVNKARYENNLAGAAAAEVARQAEAEADPFADADAATVAPVAPRPEEEADPVAPVASEPEEEDDNGPHEEDLNTRFDDRPEEEEPPGPTLAELDEIAADARPDDEEYNVPPLDDARACAESRRAPVPEPVPYEEIDH